MSADTWRWYTPTQTAIECSGETHWVRWENGQLTPLNHTAGEETLAALAGEQPACFDLIKLWTRHSEDLRVLILASRGPNDPLLAQPATSNPPGRSLTARASTAVAAMRPRAVMAPGPGLRGSFGWASAVARPMPAIRPVAPAPMMNFADDPVARLLSLSGPLADRLVAAVSTTWADRLGSGDSEAVERAPTLTAALYGRATAALRIWLGAPRLATGITMIGEDESAHIRRDDEGIEAALPFSWVPHVYSRGLSVLLGRFVLKVAEADQERIVLDTVGPDLQTKPVTISL